MKQADFFQSANTYNYAASENAASFFCNHTSVTDIALFAVSFFVNLCSVVIFDIIRLIVVLLDLIVRITTKNNIFAISKLKPIQA